MTRAAFVLLSTLITFCALGQTVNWSQGVVYEYDGSGNVKKIGSDTYVYDTGQRLIRGTVAGSQQSYGYDSFGNRTACQPGGGGDCQYGFTIDSETNRIENRQYDKRGNLLQLPEGNTLDYDELGMVRKETGSNRAVYYIYTADDERIAVYDADTSLGTHTWRWTIRGLDKKPLRELTSEGTSGTVNFKWAKDHIWRDGALLASRQLDPTAPGGVSTYHYHVDHLGTPRQVTTTSALIIGRHDYLPFGPELPNATEPQQQNLKFTGHERDAPRDHPPLDYMHARYYEPRLGRFLSVDPTWESADLGKPQSWNRYSYVRNNPMNRIDPDGRADVGLDCVPASVCTPKVKAMVRDAQTQALKVTAAVAAVVVLAVLTRGDISLAPSTGEQPPPAQMKRGPKTDPDAPHNAKVREVAGQVKDGTVIGGGGQLPERLIPTPGGHKEGRRPDVLVERPDGSIYGINVGKTEKSGVPVMREREAIEDLEGAGIEMHYVPYDRPPGE